MKQYYKILHDDLKHYDMQYHLGLNEDVKPFEPDTECGGGLFFADKEHVLDYLKYSQGTKLAIVEVPKDEQIVKVNDKYKAHRIIIKEIQELWIPENYEWLKSIFVGDNIIFQKACKCGVLNFAKWLYVNFKNLDIYENNELAFRYACENGHLDVAKWLYNLGGVDIHANNDSTFRYACLTGHLEVAKWVYDLDDIYIQLYRDELLAYSPDSIKKWLKTL